MSEQQTISALAKHTGVPSKTLRYWESLGLLKPAGRTHTGYRLFDAECFRIVEFIKKAKTIGLTLREISKVFVLSRSGRNPCPEVLRWTKRRLEGLERQIQMLVAFRGQLQQYHRRWSRNFPCPRVDAEICCLIENLPSPERPQKGGNDAKTVATTRRRRGPHSAESYGHLGGGQSPVSLVPAVPVLQVGPASRRGRD